METLSTYLASRPKGARKGDFAKEIGVSPVYLSQILSGYRRPSYDLMCRIRDASGGAVKLEAWDAVQGKPSDPPQHVGAA